MFDLDNTLVKSQYKKHKLNDVDCYIYINILGTKRIRVKLWSLTPLAISFFQVLCQRDARTA